MKKRETRVRVSLPSGKVVSITMEQYLNIDYQEMMAMDAGDYVDDPFYDSFLSGGGNTLSDRDIDIIILEIPDIGDIEDITIDEQQD